MPDDDEIAAAATKNQTAPPTATASQTPNTAPTAKVPTGGDPKVFALQNQLIAKGAKIKADGIMGPQTQAAIKQFSNTSDVQLASIENNVKGTYMSEAEKIA